MTLQAETIAYDALNRPYKTFTDRKIYANVKSVRSAEFYQATATGLKPEIIVVVKGYRGEGHLLYNAKQYRVIRSFEKGDTTELTCTSILTEAYS